MFGIDSNELLIIAIVALVVIGPKDLPRVMRAIGNFAGKARGMARHFRSGVDAMIRETELADMEKKWRSDNEKIMREHPLPAPDHAAGEDWAEPADAWPEPVAELPPPPKLAKPRLAKPRADRPKPPPRRAAGGKTGAAAPPIPAPAPPATDESA